MAEFDVQKQFHLRLAKTIATIIVKQAHRTSRKYSNLFRMLNQPSGAAIRRCTGSKSIDAIALPTPAEFKAMEDITHPGEEDLRL